jgi:hypothetical protein
MFSRKETSAHQIIKDNKGKKRFDNNKETHSEVIKTQTYSENTDHVRRDIKAKLKNLKTEDNIYKELQDIKVIGTNHLERPDRKIWLNDKSKGYIDRIEAAKQQLPKAYEDVINEMMDKLYAKAAVHGPNYTKGRNNPLGPGSKERDLAEHKSAIIADKFRRLAIFCENKVEETPHLYIGGNSKSTDNRKSSDTNIETSNLPGDEIIPEIIILPAKSEKRSVENEENSDTSSLKVNIDDTEPREKDLEKPNYYSIITVTGSETSLISEDNLKKHNEQEDKKE